MIDTCGCMKCYWARKDALMEEESRNPGAGVDPFEMAPGFRYACEICGNKRCPHHSDHTLACTNSNEPGQKGSLL